jgi:hypothetical protein
MEFLSTAEIFIPVYQMILLLLVSTLTLLFGRTKLALIINYLFTLYYLLYWGFGTTIAILAATGFLIHDW